MRSSVEAVAVARDVASSSPSKPAAALDMMRFQRPSPDCLPLPNGISSGSGGSRKQPPPPPPAVPRSSKDDVALSVATESSRLAACMASTSLEPKPRARAPLAPASPSSSPATAATRSPARDHGHGHHHPSPDFSDTASPSYTAGGASSSAASTCGAEVLLQWGQNKRSRGRRDASASGSTASPQRRQPGVKIQRRSSAPADKLMPPPNGPSYTRASNLRVSSSLPSRSGDQHHSRGALPHHRSTEERASGAGKPPAGKGAEKQQRPPGDKAARRKVDAVVGLMVPDPKQMLQHQQPHQQSGHHSQQQADHGAPGTSPSSKTAGPKPEVPRIYTTLSRKEKEEDFLAMKGTKLPQRPKKRPKNVEKAVNYICPGMWLTDVTRSKYQVREKKCPKKQKHRGLKGMESMDSDSD